MVILIIATLFSRVHVTLQPALSVRPSVGWSVGRAGGRSRFTFFMILFLWPYCQCLNGLVTSNMAPAHQHATSVSVYPALFCCLSRSVSKCWDAFLGAPCSVSKPKKWILNAILFRNDFFGHLLRFFFFTSLLKSCMSPVRRSKTENK